MQNLLYRYKMFIKRWAWIMMLGMVICGGSTYVVTSLFIKPVYQAQALVLVNVTEGSVMDDGPPEPLPAMMPTLVQLINSLQVLNAVQAKHPELTMAQLKQIVSAKQYQSNTAIIEIDVLNSDPAGAATIANDVANSFISFTNGTLGGMMQLDVYSVSQPLTPYAPKPKQDGELGAVAGLGLGLVVAIVLEQVNNRSRYPLVFKV